MDIWHTASDAHEYLDEGWLGKWSEKKDGVLPALELNGNLSLALKSEHSKALAMENPNRLRKTAEDRLFRAVASTPHTHEEEMASYLYQTARRVTQGADYLSEKIGRLPAPADYPANPLGKDLATIAALIKAGAETQVYYASLSGFDTHANQNGIQARLLENLADSLSAFRKDLQKGEFWKQTLVMVFSEFGRRVKQNAGGGTDHGTANNLWLLGGNLKSPGFRGALPSLSDLDEGDLRYHTDFREIYASVLKNWLETEPEKLFGKSFKIHSI
jgi:uncharacterized protein (DUF1501 family)